MKLSSSVSITSSAVRGSRALLLDQISASAAAYALRRLRGSYSGSAVRVRRSSDNLEADIGFDAFGDLDTAALASHCGAGSGFVVTWYDQSGNSRNATQATAGSQPRLFNAGAVELLGSRPSLFALGSGCHLTFTGASAAQVSSVASVDAATSPLGCLVATASNDESLRRTNPALGGWRCGTGADFPTQASSYLNGVVASGTYSGGQIVPQALSTPGVLTFVGASKTFARMFDNGSVTGRSFAGHVPEIILFGSALSESHRQFLERNQGAYFGVSVA